MQTQDFTLSMLVEQTPEEVFTAVNNVRRWWSETLEGNSEKKDDEFVYRHGDIHYSKQKLTEVIPYKKIVWLVTDSALSFARKQDEWTGTMIIFSIAPKENKTELVFTHKGLTAQLECFNGCSGGWNHYLKKSLLPLITTGKGIPDKKESI